MGSLENHDYPVQAGTNGHSQHAVSNGKGKASAGKRAWGFDTLQVHAGLEDRPPYGECTVPVYNTASFKFSSRAAADEAFAISTKHIYSRIHNPTTDALEQRITALEGGVDAASFSCGASAVLAVIMALAKAGDNVIVSTHTHGGTFHQFNVVLPEIGIEPRFVNANNTAKVHSLIDARTKLIFTESLGNPSLSVPDLEPLAAIAHSPNTPGGQIPLVVDATFTAAGYFFQPARWGADIIIHSATKWIGGHGTTLGGLVIETGRSDWQSNSARFPHLHGRRAGRETVDDNLYEQVGNAAFIRHLKWEVLRDTGACMSPLAAQQLFIGVETLSLRCARQAANAAAVAEYLRGHPRVKWVRYLGFEDHPYHALARKYFEPGRGFGTVVTFGLHGGAAEGLKVVDAFELVINTSNVGDAKTIIGHHWSTTHKQCTKEENEEMGVYEDLFRLSLGIEDVEDIIADFEQAFQKVVV
ncbi:hypothetical protein B0J18DRAFT_442373 [Chaetomium sp. MPI-SDFR-AT-0129]|nr:hypothetical protein B0J18DRAFT_442373 [Chaetomium sp. MPI-SDFR-AT-0129]